MRAFVRACVCQSVCLSVYPYVFVYLSLSVFCLCQVHSEAIHEEVINICRFATTNLHVVLDNESLKFSRPNFLHP